MGRTTAMLLMAALAALAVAPRMAPAATAECEPRVLRQGDGVDISAGAWSATCVPGGGCAVLGPEVDGQRLQLARRLDEARWQLVLSFAEPVDAAAGMQLAIDDAAAQNLPGEFLEARAGGRAVAVRHEVAAVVLDMLRNGRRQMTWMYSTSRGQQRRLKLSLACFAPLLQAAERRLATLRAMRQLGR